MIIWLVFAAAMPGSATAHGPAAPVDAAAQAQPKLQGLTPSEATALIAKLQAAQRDLSEGKKAYYELLAGSPASYPAADTTPRHAFLDMAFGKPWSIEKQPAHGLWQTYELRYFPPGPHSLMWKVTATIDHEGELKRVEMLYTAPPPF